MMEVKDSAMNLFIQFCENHDQSWIDGQIGRCSQLAQFYQLRLIGFHWANQSLAFLPVQPFDLPRQRANSSCCCCCCCYSCCCCCCCCYSNFCYSQQVGFMNIDMIPIIVKCIFFSPFFQLANCSSPASRSTTSQWRYMHQIKMILQIQYLVSDITRKMLFYEQNARQNISQPKD